MVFMTTEELAELIRASSANLGRRMEDLHGQTCGQLLNLQNDLTDLRRDVRDLKEGFDLAGAVSEMRRQSAELQAEVAALKRRA